MNHTKTDALGHWIALQMVAGVGNVLYLKLLAKFSSPTKVFESSAEEISRVDGITASVAGNILSFDKWDKVEAQLATIEKTGIKALPVTSSQYPRILKLIYDPPPLMFMLGDINEEDWISLAVVGSRKATGYGLITAEGISGKLARQGFTIVSGLARGIDSAAHKGALEAGGRTIAVLGSGILNIYPRENRKLAEKIADNGAIISEFLPDARPDAANFPARNRVISGLTLGTLVVEAAKRSGSLITARLASEQGREIFAIPGFITSKQSKGPNGLIKQGAKLVDDIQDIIDELQHILPTSHDTACAQEEEKVCQQEKKLSSEEGLVYNAIPVTGMHIDGIIGKTGLAADKTAALLLTLELNDLIRKEAGSFFKTGL